MVLINRYYHSIRSEELHCRLISGYQFKELLSRGEKKNDFSAFTTVGFVQHVALSKFVTRVSVQTLQNIRLLPYVEFYTVDCCSLPILHIRCKAWLGKCSKLFIIKSERNPPALLQNHFRKRSHSYDDQKIANCTFYED